MLAYICGEVKHFDRNSAIVEVGGVGYRVYCSSTVLQKLQPAGSKAVLHIHPYIREDRFDLYGFSRQEDLQLFRILIEVSGVGPKTALSVFDAGGGEAIRDALAQSDVQFFSSVPGIGKKTAQKIVIELREKAGALDDTLDGVLDMEEDEEAVLALKQLGYRGAEIRESLKKVDRGLTSSAKIKAALKYLGQI